MGSTYHPYIYSSKFFQGCLYWISILTYYVGIVTVHFIPIAFSIHFRIDNTSINSTKASKCITRKQGFILHAICHHRFRPMYHGCHIKFQVFIAQRQCITILYFTEVIANTIKTFNHAYCLTVSHNFYLRIIFPNSTY
ncbi:unknown [Tannerella sp. CAG:118]|nr:unknown [Tannerella sp. CAG:118]